MAARADTRPVLISGVPGSCDNPRWYIMLRLFAVIVGETKS
jgi:hypothetical protein